MIKKGEAKWATSSAQRSQPHGFGLLWGEAHGFLKRNGHHGFVKLVGSGHVAAKGGKAFKHAFGPWIFGGHEGKSCRGPVDGKSRLGGPGCGA